MTKSEGRKASKDAATPTSNETLYSLREVSRLTGAGVPQLRRWNRSGLLSARHRTAAGLWYTFADIVAARTAMGLVNNGVPTRQVREAVESIRRWDPELTQPLASVRVVSEAGKIAVRFEENLVEPKSGQLLMDLSVQPLVEAMGEVVHVGAPAEESPSEHHDENHAEVWLQAGLAAEQRDEAQIAIDAYRRALSFNPSHPGALLNLGNLLFAEGKIRAACELYRAATRAAPTYPEAWYNLANVLDELGHVDAAVSAYEAAIDLEPEYADAHFNLGLLWEKQSCRDRAQAHWQAYLKLEPDSASAEIAQSFLQSEETEH